MQNILMKQKKGQAGAFGQVLGVVLIAVLIIVAIFLFVTLSATFDAGSAEKNASDEMVEQFATYPVLVGLVGTVLLLGLVIGVLVRSFSGGAKGRA